MATKKNANELVKITDIEKKIITLTIVGDTPLITHCWDAKAKREMLEKQLGIAKLHKEKKNPFADFAASMYWLDPMPEELTKESLDMVLPQHPRFGFPVTGIKQSAINAAYWLKWSKDKTTLRSAFFVKADVDGYYAGDLQISPDFKSVDIIPNVFHREPMIEIQYDTVSMRDDMVKVGQGTSDIRYRAQFDGWRANLEIIYNANGDKSVDEIISIINAGGYACGIGEWRPERDGQYGMFHVEK